MEINFIFHPRRELWIVQWEYQEKCFPLNGRKDAEAFIEELKQKKADAA